MAISCLSGTRTLWLRTLGGLALERAGVERDERPLGAATQRKALALLAVLAQAGPRGVSRDKLFALLWAEAPADRAAHRLAQLLYSLRRDLPAIQPILGTTELRLNPSVFASDLAVFNAALAAGDFEAAVAAYGGPFLDGFFLNGESEFEHWVDGQRAELAQQHAGAVEALALGASRRGDHGAAVRWWRERAQADPLNSRLALAYVEALDAAGDRATALRTAEAHEILLREELDAKPTPAFRAGLEQMRGRGVVPAPAITAEPSIAVLPFLNLSPGQENEYFSDGMTEELTTVLAHLPGLRVASRTSAFVFKGRDADAREIAGRLGVTTLLEGSVRKVGNRIRLTAQLVSANDGCHLWSETYERTLADVFRLQEELAGAIARALPLGRLDEAPVVRSGTQVIEAYTFYLRGRYFAQRRTVESLRVAIEYFEQAIERDPRYALAHAGVAECWALLGFEEFGDVAPLDAMPRAKAAAQRALELEPELAEGHHWAGVVAFLFDYNWTRAAAAFQRAIDLRPGYSLAYAWYAVLLSTAERHDEAMACILKAEALDPLSFTIQTVVAHTLYFAGRYEEAIARLKALLDIEPRAPRPLSYLARTYAALGRPQDALAAAERAMTLAGRQPTFLMSAGAALAQLGRPAEARAILAELEEARAHRYVSQAHSAPILCALGSYEEMLTSLHAALEARAGHLTFLRSEPRWRPLRGDPAFEAVLSQVRATD